MLKSLKFFPIQRNGGGLVLSAGQFCEFADETAILLGGEHNLTSGLPVTFGSMLEVLMTNRDVQSIKPFSKGPIQIGSGVVAGHRASVLSGVSIGDNVVLGACAVVTRKLEPNALYAGAPATAIRALPTKMIICDGQQLPWWSLSTDYLIRNMKVLADGQTIRVRTTDLDRFSNHRLILNGTLDGVKLGQLKLFGAVVDNKQIGLEALPTEFRNYVNQMTGEGPVIVDTDIWNLVRAG